MAGELTKSSSETVQNESEGKIISNDVKKEFDRDIMDTSCDSESGEENLEYNSSMTNAMPNSTTEKPLMCQQCTVCSRKYFTQTKFDAHKCFPLPPVKKKKVENDNSKEKSKVCLKCGKNYSTKIGLQNKQ